MVLIFLVLLLEKFLVIRVILGKEMRLGWKILLSNFNILKKPYKLTFAITYKCNSKCKTCGIWKKKPKNELTLDEIEDFSKKSNFFSWFNITGGEPFLRKDIVDIAQVFLENSKDFFLFNTTTNGYTTDLIYEKTQELLTLSIPKVIVPVSLDGPKEVHENIRGVKGSWERAVETYRLLKDLEKENKNFQTFLGYTISPYNIGKFQETFLSVKEEIPDIQPLDFHANLFHSSGHYYSNIEQKSSMRNYKKELLKEIKIIEKMKGNKFFDPVFFLEKRYINLARKFVKTNKTPLKCKAMMTSCYIDPTGNVFPCTIFNKRLGNLRDVDYDLMKILNSDFAKNVRKKVEELNCPNCWTPCEAYQTILGNIHNIII